VAIAFNGKILFYGASHSSSPGPWRLLKRDIGANKPFNGKYRIDSSELKGKIQAFTSRHSVSNDEGRSAVKAEIQVDGREETIHRSVVIDKKKKTVLLVLPGEGEPLSEGGPIVLETRPPRLSGDGEMVAQEMELQMQGHLTQWATVLFDVKSGALKKWAFHEFDFETMGISIDRNKKYEIFLEAISPAADYGVYSIRHIDETGPRTFVLSFVWNLNTSLLGRVLIPSKLFSLKEGESPISFDDFTFSGDGKQMAFGLYSDSKENPSEGAVVVVDMTDQNIKKVFPGSGSHWDLNEPARQKHRD
jgi:hypothetical protein